MTTHGGDGPDAGNGGADPYGGSRPHDPDAGGSPPPPGAGPPPPPPGGTGPYGTPGPPGAGAPHPGPQAPLDGVSIASLVTALLCCTGPVAIVLGIVGTVRTRQGQRRGRWMSVLGIVLGFLATLVVAGAVVFGFWMEDRHLSLEEAEAGQCVDLDKEENGLELLKQECDEQHEAEIVAVDTIEESELEAARSAKTGYCARLVDPEEMAALQEHENLDYASVWNDPDHIEVGDHVVCYVVGQQKLDEPLLPR